MPRQQQVPSPNRCLLSPPAVGFRDLMLNEIDTVSFHGAFIILLWRRENSGRQDWKNGQGSDHGRFVYHGMEGGIYPKSVPSPSLPTPCYKTGLGWGCTTSSWGPKWSLLMVMRNRMFNKATAFYV